MQKTKNTDDLGYEFCSCGQFLFSSTKKRIKIAKGVYTTYFQVTEELELKCPKCDKIIKLKVKACMV